MRVLHLGKYYPPARGGMETFLRDLAEAQARQGLTVRVLAHGERAWRPGGRETAGGVGVERATILGRLAFAPLAPDYPLRLARLLAEFRPDVLHAHLPNPSAFALLALPVKVPLVLHWHSDVVTDGSRALRLLHPPYRILEQTLLRRAETVVATSRPYLEASRALAPHRAKCLVIPLGLDEARLGQPSADEVAAARARYLGAGLGARLEESSEPQSQKHKGPGVLSPWRGESPREGRRPSLGSPPDEHCFLVLSVGRFSHYKGFEVLVRAASFLPERARVVIAGDGPLRPGLLRLARELGLADRVTMPGGLPDAELRALMAACDCFCLPSVARAEAFGLVLAEAMSLGRPLVSSRLPGSGMLVVNQEGVTGLAFRPGDPHDLAESVRRLMNDRSLRERLGSAGRERFARSMGITPVARETGELYERLSARATRRQRTGDGPGV